MSTQLSEALCLDIQTAETEAQRLMREAIRRLANRGLIEEGDLIDIDPEDFKKILDTGGEQAAEGYILLNKKSGKSADLQRQSKIIIGNLKKSLEDMIENLESSNGELGDVEHLINQGKKSRDSM